MSLLSSPPEPPPAPEVVTPCSGRAPLLGGLSLLDDPTTLRRPTSRTLRDRAADIARRLVAEPPGRGDRLHADPPEGGSAGSEDRLPERGDATNPRCETCGGKATLCKPGGEALRSCSGFAPASSAMLESWEDARRESGLEVTLVCELTTAAGVVVAGGRGAPPPVTQGFGDVNHKTIKMVQKSALRSRAVLRCAGLSGAVQPRPRGSARGGPGCRRARRVRGPRRTEPARRPLRGGCGASSSTSCSAPSPRRRRPATVWPADRRRRPEMRSRKPRIGRLYALLHDAISGADVPDDQHTVVFERARDAGSPSGVATTQGRPTIAACSYRAPTTSSARGSRRPSESALQGGAAGRRGWCVSARPALAARCTERAIRCVQRRQRTRPAAMALRLHELGDAFALLFTPTGDEAARTPRACRPDRGASPEVPARDPPQIGACTDWIATCRALPSFRMRWCTRQIKIAPCIAYLLQHPGSTLLVGLRADEEQRVGLYGEYATYRYPHCARVGLAASRRAAVSARPRRHDPSPHGLRALLRSAAQRVVCALEAPPGACYARGEALAEAQAGHVPAVASAIRWPTDLAGLVPRLKRASARAAWATRRRSRSPLRCRVCAL